MEEINTLDDTISWLKRERDFAIRCYENGVITLDRLAADFASLDAEYCDRINHGVFRL